MLRSIHLIRPAVLCVLLALALQSCKTDMTTATPELEAIILDTAQLELSIDETYTFKVQTVPEETETELIWSSNDPDIASVENGTVTAHTIGTTTLIVSCGAIYDQCEVIVKPKSNAVEKVTLDQTEVTIMTGQSITLNATVEPADVEYALSWVSDKPEVATVDNGQVTGVTVGTANIIVTAGLKRDTCTVTVEDAVKSVTLDIHEKTIKVGETFTLSADVETIDAEAEYELTWTSSDPSIAYVEDGVVSGYGEGTADIIVTAGTRTDICKVTVEPSLQNAKVGDYFYSDGTWSTELDPEKTVIGLVFYTGNIAAQDPTLAGNHPQCTNGLVVSLNYIQTTWQDMFVDVNSWITENTSYEDITDVNKANGYNNTKAMEEYNNSDPDYPVNAVQKVVDYRTAVPAPENTTSWYLPSIKELVLLAAGDVSGDITNVTPSTSNMTELDKIMETIPGTDNIVIPPVQDWFFSQSCYYVSSTEYLDMKPWSIAADTGEVVTVTGKMDMNYVRPILAF